MPDIKSVLNDEIRRLAKKEIKVAVIPLLKTVQEQKRAIAELKKQIADLEKRVPVKKAAAIMPVIDDDKKVRLNAAGIVRLRTKLKLTQAEFAKLLGVSSHTVSVWEIGKVAPRASAKQAICAMRGVGKRVLKQRLEELNSQNAEAK